MTPNGKMKKINVTNMFARQLRQKSLPLVRRHSFRASLATSCMRPLLKHLYRIDPTLSFQLVAVWSSRLDGGDETGWEGGCLGRWCYPIIVGFGCQANLNPSTRRQLRQAEPCLMGSAVYWAVEEDPDTRRNFTLLRMFSCSNSFLNYSARSLAQLSPQPEILNIL